MISYSLYNLVFEALKEQCSYKNYTLISKEKENNA